MLMYISPSQTRMTWKEKRMDMERVHCKTLWEFIRVFCSTKASVWFGII